LFVGAQPRDAGDREASFADCQVEGPGADLGETGTEKKRGHGPSGSEPSFRRWSYATLVPYFGSKSES
jgi:hypothetical protein